MRTFEGDLAVAHCVDLPLAMQYMPELILICDLAVNPNSKQPGQTVSYWRLTVGPLVNISFYWHAHAFPGAF